MREGDRSPPERAHGGIGEPLFVVQGTLDGAPVFHEVSSGEARIAIAWMPNLYTENFATENFFYARRSEPVPAEAGATFLLPIYEPPSALHCGPTPLANGGTLELCFGVPIVYDHGFAPYREAVCWNDPLRDCFFEPMGWSLARVLLYLPEALPTNGLPDLLPNVVIEAGFHVPERHPAEPWESVHACDALAQYARSNEP